jgi:hypothetical protein
MGVAAPATATMTSRRMPDSLLQELSHVGQFEAAAAFTWHLQKTIRRGYVRNLYESALHAPPGTSAFDDAPRPPLHT